MFSKSSLLAVVSALALALPSVQGFAITGCYAAGLVTELVADITTIENTNIDSNEACAVSTSPPYTCTSRITLSDRIRLYPLSSAEITATILLIHRRVTPPTFSHS